MEKETCNHLYYPGPLPGRTPTQCSKCGRLEKDVINSMEKETWDIKLGILVGNFMSHQGVTRPIHDLVAVENDSKAIVDFISSLLASQKEKMLGVLEKLESNYDFNGIHASFRLDGTEFTKKDYYLRALSDIKKKIEDL